MSWTYISFTLSQWATGIAFCYRLDERRTDEHTLSRPPKEATYFHLRHPPAELQVNPEIPDGGSGDRDCIR